MTRKLQLAATEAAALARVSEGGTFLLVGDASYDLRCPTCGGSASLPLEMTCSDHHPQMTAPAEFVQACAPCHRSMTARREMIRSVRSYLVTLAILTFLALATAGVVLAGLSVEPLDDDPTDDCY